MFSISLIKYLTFQSVLSVTVGMYLGAGLGIAAGTLVVLLLIVVGTWMRCKGYRCTKQKVIFTYILQEEH